jgi:serine/threonine protein kinase
VLAAGTSDAPGGKSVHWLAMEFMEGGDLAKRLKHDGPVAMDRGVRWLRHTLEGLAYAHRQGVIHRDLKPHNLLLTGDDDVKVGDFGLVRNTKHNLDMGTVRGSVLGTPYYMAPEQAVGEVADERSDLYAVGATFFQLFSGRLPFEEKSSTAVLVAIAHRDAPRLSDVLPDVPRPLDVIITRLMARHPQDRYQDARVVLEDLASYERRGLLGMPEPLSAIRTTPMPIDATVELARRPTAS